MNTGSSWTFPPPPRGIKAIPWRLPIYLYRFGLGWLLGNRFLLLCHTGRISGEKRFAVVEIVHSLPDPYSYFVVSGFGTRSDWYQNIIQNTNVEIQVGRKRLLAEAQQLDTSEAGEILLAYAQNNPRSLKALSKIMGYEIDFSHDGILDFGRQIPVIQFAVSKQITKE